MSHRSVAREAELPTTASTYYFSSLDALLTATLTQCMDEDSQRLRDLIAAPDGSASDKIQGLARLMADVLSHRGHLLAEFELCLLASRRAELRGPTNRWTETLRDFARLFTDSPLRVELFANAYDGMLLRGLLRDEPPGPADFEALLRELLPPPD
ncbi:TetR/AcrR family transcriptional regulator [Streptomyces sp. NPDC048172]|uniref:TetR/AcrR family transcriptional regulator n=1 Tax=Streptomyces sp. NPDC048172 TaxID=3365505 RepID=UPI0037116710